jgi:hypothetical protein
MMSCFTFVLLALPSLIPFNLSCRSFFLGGATTHYSLSLLRGDLARVSSREREERESRSQIHIADTTCKSNKKRKQYKQAHSRKKKTEKSTMAPPPKETESADAEHQQAEREEAEIPSRAGDTSLTSNGDGLKVSYHSDLASRLEAIREKAMNLCYSNDLSLLQQAINDLGDLQTSQSDLQEQVNCLKKHNSVLLRKLMVSQSQQDHGSKQTPMLVAYSNQTHISTLSKKQDEDEVCMLIVQF